MTTEGGRIWSALHVAFLAAALGALVISGRGQWFFGDEWDFLLYRGLHDPRWDLLRPHNEHWSTIPILWYRALFSVVGLRNYWPYLGTVFALHVVAVHFVWRLMRRAGVTVAVATAVAVPFAFYGGGWENLTWAFQVGFVGSLVAGLGLLLLIDERGSRLRVGVVASGAIAALMLSGISVVMIGATALAALGRWGWRKAAVVTVPSSILYVVWTLFPGRIGLTGATSEFRGGPDDVPRFVWHGLSATIGAPFGSDHVGAVLVVVLGVVVVVCGRSWWRRSPETMALAVAAPALFAVISQGRGAFVDPVAPRYIYLAAGMLTPLVGLAVDQLAQRDHRRRLLVAVTCATLGVVGGEQLLREARHDAERDLTLKGQLLASIGVAANEPTVSNRPDFAYYPGMKVADLVALARKRHLPVAVPTSRDLAYARLALQARVVARAPAVNTVSATALAPPGASVSSAGVCATVDLEGGNAVIHRSGTTPAIFSLTSWSTGPGYLFVPFDSGVAGPRTLDLKAGRPVTVAEVLDGPLLLQLPSGNHTVCGVRWTAAT